jgi:hypothetical protein
MKLAKLVRDAGFNPRGAIPMNRLSFGRPIQATLQFREKFQGLVFLSSGDEQEKLFLGQTGIVQKPTIHQTTTESRASLFCSRGSIGHNFESCPKLGGDVNP